MVDFKVPAKAKLEPRWMRGVYLGLDPDSLERICGTDKGCIASAQLRRVPEEERYDSQAISQVRGFPWKPIPDHESDGLEMPAGIAVIPDTPEHPSAPVVPVEHGVDVGPRRYYITSRDLEKYGYTQGCPACAAIRAKKHRVSAEHGLRQR